MCTIVCVIGKSGVGKSTFSNLLAKELNAKIINVDEIGHNIYKNDEVKVLMKNCFGSAIFTNGEVDRKKLGKIVLVSKDEMDKLTNITWNFMQNKIDSILNSEDGYVILDWLLLAKTKYFSQSIANIKIETLSEETRKEKLKQRDKINSNDIINREFLTKYNNDAYDLLFFNDYNIETLKIYAVALAKLIKHKNSIREKLNEK